MKLLIVSDSHGNKQILNDLVSKYTDKVDAFVHCGDSELSSKDLIWEMVETVRGNCDYDIGYKDLVINRNFDYHYAILHGHNHEVKWSLEPMKELAKKAKVSLVFYGHSHILKVDNEDGVFFINPGSIQSPRGNIMERTYCMLSIGDDSVIIEIYNDYHEKLDTLTFSVDKLTKF